MTLKLIKFGAVLFGLFCVQGMTYAADDADGELRRITQAYRGQTRQIQDEMLGLARESIGQHRMIKNEPECEYWNNDLLT